MEALHQLAGKFQQTLTKYNYTPTFVSNETNKRGESIFNYFSNGEEGAVYFTDDANFFDALNAKFNASIIRVLKEKHGVTYESLSQKWSVSIEAAKIKVQHTSHRGIKMILRPYLSCLFNKKKSSAKVQ